MATNTMSKFLMTRNWTLAEKLAHYSAPPDANGCVLWTGGSNARGYGRLRWQGLRRFAHRLAMECASGPIPEGMDVCHKCDVPACINPAHLFLGTNAANMADMWAKGRARPPRGESVGGAKLVAADVLTIRAARGTQDAIAAQFGVSRALISYIKRRKSWAHIPEARALDPATDNR